MRNRGKYKRYAKQTQHCHVCGREFKGRYGAKTCSAKCRKKLSRMTTESNGLTPERKSNVTDFRSNICDIANPLGRVFVEVKI